MNDRHDDDTLHAETHALGLGYDPFENNGAVKPPAYLTSTFQFRTAAEGERFFQLASGKTATDVRDSRPMVYSRFGNPNLELVEKRLAAFDASDEGVLFASGMAAISTSMLALLSPGEHVVATGPLYGGTHHFLAKVLPRFGIHSTFVPSGTDTIASIREAAAQIKGERLRMIYVETPANPSNALVDIAAVVHLADRLSHGKERPVLTTVDNTLLGPVFQKPAELGVDLTLYSATKFIGGHSDLIAGAATGRAGVCIPIVKMRSMLGTMATPFTGWLLLRSLETIGIRMRRQAETASRLAKVLEGHKAISRVFHLSLLDAEDPQHEIYQRQCTGPGSVISFEVRGGKQSAFKVLDRFDVARLAVSLGGTESLVQHPASMTHSDVPRSRLEEYGISQGLIRMSVGLEHPEDLERDLLRALDAVKLSAERREDVRTTQVIRVPIV